MSSSRGGSQGARGRGDRQGGGSRLQPGAFDGLSDGDSMSNSGTNFTLPQVRGSQQRVRRGFACTETWDGCRIGVRWGGRTVWRGWSMLCVHWWKVLPRWAHCILWRRCGAPKTPLGFGWLEELGSGGTQERASE